MGAAELLGVCLCPLRFQSFHDPAGLVAPGRLFYGRMPHFLVAVPEESWLVSHFPYQRTHDAVLGATLRRHGVKVFYTRNVKDFADAGLPSIINPID